MEKEEEAKVLTDQKNEKEDIKEEPKVEEPKAEEPKVKELKKE